MKKYFVDAGQRVLRLFVILYLIIFLLVVVSTSQSFLQCMGTTIIGSIILIYIVFPTYLLLSIHDNLVEINNKLTNNQEEKSIIQLK